MANLGISVGGKGFKKKLADIYEAIKKGDEKRVQHLLEAENVNPNTTDEAGRIALHTATMQGANECIIDLLLANGSNVDAVDTVNGFTALHYATTKGENEGGSELIADLIERGGADVNVQSWDGDTPMHVASKTGADWAVSELLGAGAEVNVSNDEGFTPMHFAAMDGSIDVMKRLQENGADVNAKSATGSTPLHCAAVEGKEDALQFLVDSGGDINAANDRGFTPMGVAELAKHTKLARKIKRQGGSQPQNYITEAESRMKSLKKQRQEARDRLLKSMADFDEARKPKPLIMDPILIEKMPIQTAEFGEDNTIFLATGNVITAWNIKTSELLNTYEGHSQNVTAVCYDSDAGALHSGSEDMTLRSWDINTGECTSVMEGHTNAVTSIVAADGMLYSASKHDMRAWDLIHSQICIFLFTGHVTNQTCLKLYKDELYSGELDQESWGSAVKVYNIADGLPIRAYGGHSGSILTIEIVSNVLWTSDDNGAILATDVETGDVLRRFVRGNSQYYSLYVTPDWVFAGTGAGVVDQWSLNVQALVHQIGGPMENRPVSKLLMIPGDGRPPIEGAEGVPGDRIMAIANESSVFATEAVFEIPVEFTGDDSSIAEAQEQAIRVEAGLYQENGEPLRCIVKVDCNSQKRKMEVPMDIRFDEFEQTLFIAYSISDDHLILTYENLDGEMSSLNGQAELLAAFQDCVGTGPNNSIKRLLIKMTTSKIEKEKEESARNTVSAASKGEGSDRAGGSSRVRREKGEAKKDAIASKLLKLDAMKRKRMKKFL